MEGCLVATILARLYPRISSLEAALEDLKGSQDILLCSDSDILRKTCESAIVAWSNRRLYLDIIGLYKEEKQYDLPATRGKNREKSSSIADLERVVRSAKRVRMNGIFIYNNEINFVLLKCNLIVNST